MGTEIGLDIATRLTGATTDVATRVTGAIRDAARATGAGFEYLLNTAIRESNLNPDAKAKTSSATGLFQFIDQTWLGTMKQSGASLGYGKQADAISRTASGKYVVSDPAMREQILALRKDPTANALMAGAFANANAKVLTERLGRKPTDGELYMAHFLGAAGASRFIKAAEANPNGTAAGLFPRAAAANRSIFYDKTGSARSLKQVYAGLISKHNVIGSATQVAAANPTATAKSADAVTPSEAARSNIAISAAKTTPALAAATTLQTADNSVLAPRSVKTISITSPNTAGVAPAAPARETVTTAAVQPTRATAEVAATSSDAPASFTDRVSAFAVTDPGAKLPEGPIFRTLYQNDGRGAVAPVVRELWGPRAAVSPDTSSAVAAPTDVSAQRSNAPALNAPLDLFQFMRPVARRPA